MCGKAPAVIQFEERIGTGMKDRLSMRLILRGRIVGEELYLCPETVDFMISHLTKMRKQFVSECR